MTPEGNEPLVLMDAGRGAEALIKGENPLKARKLWKAMIAYVPKGRET